jgi:hypothetical protein
MLGIDDREIWGCIMPGRAHQLPPNRAGESWSGLEQRDGGHPASSGATDTRAGEGSPGGGGLGARLVGRRRALDGHGDDLLAAEEEEA